MDPELKDYLDGMFVAITDQIGRVDQRMDGLEHRLVTIEGELQRFRADSERRFERLEERLIDMDQRFRSQELRTEQFEVRVTDRLDSIDGRTARIEKRTDSLEHHLLTLHTRFDALGEDMRQRFRTINDRLAGAA